ncbi:hypothetical protein Pint_02954 [Pistacia integerrima]|uniref:Uncharacterized protein n=2 Tax=Pistacia TaxID=55512 RepID=A0ACC1CA50_9ROSI|nr:hypothetical protein Pint_02954 [Pistacia integerrima]KAJ0112543.1 hypothetical protein Patl1_02989 [Pistacia atlantica]
MVFEAEGSVGGKLRSISQGGLIWDEGANTMVNIEVDCPLANQIYPLGAMLLDLVISYLENSSNN